MHYITAAEAEAIHSTEIESFGGTLGIRDYGLLKAALLRPQTGRYTDLIDQAAALWEGLAQHRPFMDGNKRAASAVTSFFLARNGMIMTADRNKSYAFTVMMQEARTSEHEPIANWLRANTKAIQT